MSEAMTRLAAWKYGTQSDPGYNAGNQDFANDVCALMERAEKSEQRIAELEELIEHARELMTFMTNDDTLFLKAGMDRWLEAERICNAARAAARAAEEEK